LVLILALLVSIVGCRSTRHTVEPYRDDLEAAASLVARASQLCSSREPDSPPHEFVTDGCSMFLDSDWVECCVEHDLEYWCGGTADERRLADRALAACVAEAGRPTLGWWMGKGVRVGGIPWPPTSWRWGYGWDWPTGYTAEAREGNASSE